MNQSSWDHNITADVMFDEELPANAKLLYGVIRSLCQREGYCWASNDYLSELFKKTNTAVSGWIKKLAEKKLIFIENPKSHKRRIFMRDSKHLIKKTSEQEENVEQDLFEQTIKKDGTTYKKCLRKVKENFKQNTSSNEDQTNTPKDISAEPIVEKPFVKKAREYKKKVFEEMTDYEKVVDTYWNCFIAATGNEPMINGTTGKHVKMLLKQPLDQVLVVIHKYFEQQFWFNENKEYDFKQITCHYNSILSAPEKKNAANSDWYETNKAAIDAKFAGVN